METLWFCLVVAMLSMYVVFDGFVIGAGVIHLVVGRNDDERGIVKKTIGPVWDANQVWLLAAGGTLFFAFPTLYASSFSGFYLPLMMILWLLILRGIALGFRDQMEGRVWVPFWDTVFAGSSLLLAIFYGAALGNVVRGVPLDENGRFFEPLWTNFAPRGMTGILDWYTVLTGVVALVVIALHGALWVLLKTDGIVAARCRALVSPLWWSVLLGTAAITVATLSLQPQVWGNLTKSPWGFVFPAVAVAGLAGMRLFVAKQRERHAFLASCAFVIGMLWSAAFGLFPFVLPSSVDPALGMTAHAAAAPLYGLKVGLAWWIPGMLGVAAYFVYAYRKFAGKVTAEQN